MKRIMTAACAAAMLAFGAPAIATAGDAKMTRSDGTQLKIKCRNSGCTVTALKPGSKKWGTVEKGPGGTKNFQKLEAKYKAAGFN